MGSLGIQFTLPIKARQDKTSFDASLKFECILYLVSYLVYFVFSSKPKEIPETPDDNSIDIGVVRYSPGELQPKTFKAKEEDQRTCEKLMPSFTDEEIAEVTLCLRHMIH